MLIYPAIQLKTRKQKNITECWDIVRKQWIALTPEELVRQHFVHYLIHQKKYPIESIVVEKKFEVFSMKKRFDVAVINKKQEFVLIAECKSPEVKLDEKVIQQILTYNLTINARCLVLTNGLAEIVFEKINDEWRRVQGIREWKSII
jgi:hypothetical protein